MRAGNAAAVFAWLGLASLLVSSGCASTPQATPQRDADAKQFVGHPGYAGIYVYRPDTHRPEVNDPVLHVDDRLLGAVLPRSFFRFDTQPGAHVIYGSTFGSTELKLETRPGELYFVQLNVIGGSARLALVDPETAKRAIRGCCALMENWAPGQRPLLR